MNIFTFRLLKKIKKILLWKGWITITYSILWGLFLRLFFKNLMLWEYFLCGMACYLLFEELFDKLKMLVRSRK